MREHRAERRAAHGGGVDDHRLLVASSTSRSPSSGRPKCEPRSTWRETPSAMTRALRGASSSRTVTSPAGRAWRERRDGEDRADVGVATLERGLHGRGERIDEDGAASLAGREGNDERRRGWKQEGGSLAAQRADERRAALQQREARRDELLHFVLGAVTARAMRPPGGERQRQEGKGIAHSERMLTEGRYSSKRRSEPLSRSATMRELLTRRGDAGHAGGLLLHDGADLLRGGGVRFGRAGERLDLAGERLRLAALRVGRLHDAVHRGARAGDLAIDLRERVGGCADDASPAVTRSLAARICSSVRTALARISAASLRICSSARALSPASLRTSSATTAKPLPCSPARDADGGVEREQVGLPAMSSMASGILPIRCDFSPSSTTAGTAAPVTALISAMASSAWAAAMVPRRVVRCATSAAARACSA